MAKATSVKQSYTKPYCIVFNARVLLGAFSQDQIDRIRPMLKAGWIVIPCDWASRYVSIYDRPSEVAKAEGLTSLAKLFADFGA